MNSLLNFKETAKKLKITEQELEDLIISGEIRPRIILDGIIREICAYRDENHIINFKLRD